MGIIIYGVKRKLKEEKSLGVQFCPNCGKQVELQLTREKVYGHVYYIPLLPMSGWKVKLCPNCGVAAKLTPEEYKALKQG